ncbi:MAG: glycoside-pentoside-hexuronide (GPH):cation symporter [Propionibacteriaceae bacterium]|nr:glycoside-pentoside-hexuronide (GPH):cation symporter [Propionibacteriaceae bacterium]
MKNLDRQNRWTFAVGTLGRDMVYILISMFLVNYLIDLQLSSKVFAWVSALILLARLFDAVTDFVMGSIVDNTRTRWGNYKPWIFVGMIAAGVLTILLFTDFGARGFWFVILFAGIYLLWGLSWTMNDIPYWSLMPALTLDQKERERISSRAKIFATIGTFAVVVGIIPFMQIFEPRIGLQKSWLLFAVIIVVAMMIFQSVTLIWTKEPDIVVEQDKITLKDIVTVVFKNDQLLWTCAAMVTFMTGYLTFSSFGVKYFEHVYGNKEMYSPFGAVMGVAMIAGYVIFPILRKAMARSSLYTLATGLAIVGYVIFFFSPPNIIILGVAAFLLFFGSALIIVLMLVFVSDTIDYGHWKLGRRNTAITFALQPFISKVGAALGTMVVAMTAIATGLNQIPEESREGYVLDPSDQLTYKIIMVSVPIVLTLVGYAIYRWKYRIDETFHAEILTDLEARGQLVSNAEALSVKEG